MTMTLFIILVMVLDLINNEEVKQKVIVKGKSVKIIKITK